MHNIHPTNSILLGDNPIDYYKFDKKDDYIDIWNIKDKTGLISDYYSIATAIQHFHDMGHVYICHYQDYVDGLNIPLDQYELEFKKIMSEFIEKYGNHKFYMNVEIIESDNKHGPYSILHQCSLNDMKYINYLISNGKKLVADNHSSFEVAIKYIGHLNSLEEYPVYNCQVIGDGT